jgi:MAF protein
MNSGLGNTNQRRLILASASPRRKELFALTGWMSEIMAVEVDERPQHGENPIGHVTRLAQEKGQKASLGVGEPHILIAADTIVIDDERILGKPTDRDDAKRILKDLAGRSHRVITSLVIVDSARGTTHVDLCETAVPMRNYSRDEIDEYVDTGSPMDKAGAYGIQDNEFHPVETGSMIGCYANVMGLPLCHLTRSMKKNGLQPPTDVPEACQSFTKYRCKVYQDILRFRT